MRSGPDFFGDCTQSGPESQDRTVSQSRPDWTAKSYFGPVRSQSLGPVRSVYKYQNLAVTMDDQPRSSTASQTLNGIFRQHRQNIGPNRVSSAVMNEAENYLQAPIIGEDSEIPVLQLWKRIESSYPSLALMARDILAVPGMLVFISLTPKRCYAQNRAKM